MKHLELKNSVLSDLQLITDLAIEDIKNDNVKNGWKDDTDEFIENGEWFDKKRENRIYELIRRNYDLFPAENIELEYCRGKYTFPIQQAPILQKEIKSKWGNGKFSVKNKTTHQLNDRSKDLQKQIMNYREAYQNGSYTYNEYQGSYFGYYETKTIFKEQVIQMYERSEPGDIIRLCWKFITSPETLEGVHTTWVDPQVKFEPYGSFEVPEYMKTKTAVA